MNINNISIFNNINDYLPILNGAILTDMGVLLLVIFGYIKSKSLKKWYNLFNLSAFIADVLSIVIGVIISRYLYPLFFTKYDIFNFIFLTVLVQFTHDILFSKFFYSVPRGNSLMLDVFKDYGNELGGKILLADASMMISTIILGGIFANYSTNFNIILIISLIYISQYLLYSI
jgi:hypothetical protein